MDNEIIVKVADSPESMEAIFEVRRTVFVIEQSVSEEEEYDEFESSSTHLFATCDNQVVGTCRFRNTTQGTKLERFAVLKAYRTRSVGASLLKAALAAVDHDRMIYLHAQVQVIEFYKKYGFSQIGAQFEEAGIQHFKMIYSVDDLQ
ncbi:MAG: GNAT family N-acetyltransferase [Bacteroidia bacterium]|nr:GNAT family N-acetyltransferase [Bacteroidia bacterium]